MDNSAVLLLLLLIIQCPCKHVACNYCSLLVAKLCINYMQLILNQNIILTLYYYSVVKCIITHMDTLQ